MCGITGFIDFKNTSTSEDLVSMTNVLEHRGPDDYDVFFEENTNYSIGLGHRRLSIIDLSANGKQPFFSEDKQHILVFNGEVYNYQEVRAELITLGYSFRTDTDTEVILKSYLEWGNDCLDKFIGMFSIILFDKVKDIFFIARDRAGVKPLYYYLGDECVLFSSELKSFHQSDKFKKELNESALPFYFKFGYIPAPHTIFENCFKLKPGHTLTINLKTQEKTYNKYWDLLDFHKKEPFQFSETKIIKDVEELLTSSLKYRMVSDVPVGLFLSGGYDSTLMTAILSKHFDKLKTFTIGFDDPKFNEANHAKVIAKRLGTEHYECYCREKEMEDIINQLPHFFDEPFADTSAIPTILLSKFASKEVTVALSGDGGDEAFAGYSKYFALERITNLSKLKRTGLTGMTKILGGNSVEMMSSFLPKKYRQSNIKDKFYKLQETLSFSSPSDMFANASSGISQKVLESMGVKWSSDELAKTYFSNFNAVDGDILQKMMLTDYYTFMIDDVLVKTDRSTMSASIEGREPLIDHRLFEYLSRVPNSIKYKNKTGKYLLRQVLYKYIPQSLVDKPKSGFVLPIEEMLRKQLRYLVEKHLLSEVKDEKTYYDKKAFKTIVHQFLNGESRFFHLVWRALMFEMWKEKWMN